MDSHLKLVLKGDPEELLLLLIRLQDPGVVPPYCRVITQFGDIIACRVKRKYLLYVYNSPSTFSVKAPRLIPAPLKEAIAGHDVPFPRAAPSRMVPTPYSGKGVYFAAVDWGFDFAHANLRKPDGTTRFACIWDQNGIYDGNRYGFGCMYTEAEINEALKSDTPYQTLGYHPGKNDLLGAGMHGTHVVDIATGTRAIGEGGIAPGATLIGVELGSNLVNGSDLAMGDSCRLLLALDFIYTVPKPAGSNCVINMSLGSHGDSHTGRSLVEIAFDNFLQQNPGYALVQSVGNYYRAHCHIHHTLQPSQSYSIEWNIPRRNHAPNEVEIWYNHGDRFSVNLVAPDGELVAEVAPFEDIEILYRGDAVGYIFQRDKEPNTGMNHIDIILDNTVLTGKWIIELTGDTVTNGTFHAYCERNDASQARFSPHQSSPYTTTGSVCNGQHTISVGAYNHHVPLKPVVSFSSSGPTVFGQPKPDLLAPGYKIQAACSAPASLYTAGNGLTTKSGSSMAAPHVSGTIALLFEKYHPQKLSVPQIKKLLFASLDPLPGYYTAHDRIRAGKGLLNIAALLNDKAYNMNTSDYTRTAQRIDNIPIALGEEDAPATVPALTGSETTPASETLYVAIDLGLRKECSSRDPKTYQCTQTLRYDVEAKTGIFFPAAFTPKPEIDLLIYLHGHKPGYVKDGRDLAIDRFWNKNNLPKFAFRELLNQAGNNLVLVAPTLGPFSQPGTLTTDKGFTGFMNQVMAAISTYSAAYKGKTAPIVKSIILAAHSGGGIRMRAIAGLAATNPYAGLIKECWGFDCTYSGDDPKVWHNWAATNTGKTLYLYSIAGTDTATIANQLNNAGYRLPNIHVLPAATSDHNSVPQAHLVERLTGKSAAPVTPPKKAAGNNNGTTLSPLMGAVGKGGQNQFMDVLTVQTLLNTAGIPVPVTGQTAGTEGDVTVLAIYHYQKKKKLPYYDGKIDPNGATIKSLLQYAQPANGHAVPPTPTPTPMPAPTPGPTPANATLDTELAAHPHCMAYYKNTAAYKKIRDQVASWKIANPADYIEEALQQWNANSEVHGYFEKNFDGDAHRSFLNLKRLYKAKCINDPGNYFKTNIVSVRFFNKSTPAHQALAAVLKQVQAAFTAAGQTFTFDSAWSFVPRTFNASINKLSNHAMGKAIDINPATNPHITSADDIKVINAVCSSVLPNGLLRETDPDVLRNASSHFQQYFTDAWIAQQTDAALITAINKRRIALKQYAGKGFLTLPTAFIKGMMNAGLVWGGSWNTAKDFMHFELRHTDECS